VPSALVYVPMPPSRYLTPKSPGNASSLENMSGAIVLLKVTLVRLLAS
jgi:hypothetical protein